MHPKYAGETPFSFTRVLVIIGLVCGALALLVAISGYEPPLPAAMVEQYQRGGRDDVPLRKRGGFRREEVEEGPSDAEEEEEVLRPRHHRTGARGQPLSRRDATLAAEEQEVEEVRPPPRKRLLVKACPACPECPVLEPAPAREACPPAPPPPPPVNICPDAPAAPVSGSCPSGAAAIAEYDGYAVERVDRSRNAVFSTLSEAVAATKHPRLNLATFIQGNAGFHPLTKNWIAMVRALSPALPYFVVALDEVEAGNVKALGAPVYLETRKKYDPSASSYRETGYNQMTLNKWGVTRDILKLGVSAFMVDPDIAMLRNPLPYFETLPTCDYITMMEGDSMDGRADEVIAAGGYHEKAYNIDYDNLMNTGYSLFRSTPRMIALLDEFEGYVAGGGGNRGVEDQTVWADFLRERFELKDAPRSTPVSTRGQAVVDAVIKGRCLEYVRMGDADKKVVWTFHPLNPHMFMNRPAHDKRKLQEKVLERPFAVHYNYLVGTDAKVNGMRSNGHYVV